MRIPLLRSTRASAALAAILLASCDRTTEPRMADGRSANRSTTALETVYGTERFTRAKGAPERVVRTISTAGFEAPFVLEVTSGDAAGAHRVSSATIQLDGATILGPSDFSQSRASWSVSVSPGVSSQLAVTVAGAPGGYLDIALKGVRSGILFCPDARPGSIADLQAAINATPVDGTLLVCDGEHTVKATIDKPMTMRSENPGGAILADADLVASGQAADPIILISGIPSGLVRVADIGFRVADHGVEPSAPFDKVEIDSVEFIGVSAPLPGVTVVAVRAEGVVPASSRVSVTNSSFDGLGLGVWPVTAVETNVSHSTFNHFTGGGVVYSNGNTPTTQSYGRTEHNQFTNCGTAGCIRVLTTGAVVVANNHIDVGTQPITLGAITLQSTSQHPGASGKVIEDNEIISTATAAPANTPAGWMSQYGIFLADGNAAAHTIRRNRISNTFAAFNVQADVEAQDNVVTGGFHAFVQAGTRSVRIQRNDFNGILGSFTAPAFASQYQCNWWGSATGPVSPPPAVPTAMYTPFATTPIAGTAIPCDPGANLGVVRVCPSGGPGTVTTLAAAVALVVPNGTIRLCDGTHASPDVILSKSMFVESEGPAGATLDAGAAAQALTINGTALGTTTILTRLRFIGGTANNVLMGAGVRNLTATGNEFHPPQTAPYGGALGVRAGIASLAPGVGGVNLSSNRFIGGDVGVYVTSNTGGSVFGNEFDGQANAAFWNDTPGVGSAVLNLNYFSNCGPSVCVFARRAVSFTNNTATIDIARPTATVLHVLNTTGTSSFQSNTITGTGEGGVDRTAPSTYPISGPAAILSGTITTNSNRITNAWAGIAVTSGAITGTNNFIQRSYTPLVGQAPGTGTITLQRSDLTDFIVPILNPASFASLNLRCNYWGSAGGPTGVPLGFEPAFNPFSSVPIALTSVVCTP